MVRAYTRMTQRGEVDDLVHKEVYRCYDCADEGLVVAYSFLDEHRGHDVRREFE